ncbi:MAG TPA: TIGR00730 family Rossman fold protein [Vicinamibacterales bacterium]
MRRVCVFCGSSTGNRAVYADAAKELAREMVRRGIGLVFGGGAVGLMGVIADAVLAAGGHAIGVIPHALVARELAHRALPDLRVVNSMHERKATMAELADAFVAMPGGFGTFEEFCEVVTWTQLGVHRKSCGLLNVGGFYDALIAQFDRGVAEGFIKTANRRIVVAHPDPGALLDALARAPAPPEAAWIGGPEET